MTQPMMMSSTAHQINFSSIFFFLNLKAWQDNLTKFLEIILSPQWAVWFWFNFSEVVELGQKLQSQV